MEARYATEYRELERSHWWFRARRVLLKSLLTCPPGWKSGMQVLEVGTGPGENLYSLYPNSVDLYGLEPDAANAQVADERGLVPVYRGSLENLPDALAGKAFDVITLFDVLEHIEDDAAALGRIHDLLKPEGHLVLSVPAFPFLWGRQDVVNHHYRRYTAGTLVPLLIRKGFRPQRTTYFNFWLFPMIALVRVGRRWCATDDSPENVQSDFAYRAGPLSSVLFRIFRSEARLLRRISFPFGVSWFCVARREGR